MERNLYKKIALCAILVCLCLLSYCVYLAVKNVNLQEKAMAHSVGVLDGVALKQNAKCFSVHAETSKMLSDVFTQIRRSEKAAREEYERIVSSKKLSHKKKQQEIKRIELRWNQASETYNKKVADIKLLDAKISEKISQKLEEVLQEIVTDLNLIVVFNKGSETSLNVFYNIPSLDITDKVIKSMDRKLTGFSIKSVLDSQ